MCGICLILNVAIDNHHFNFNFFHTYNPSPHADLLPLNKHIQQHQLILPPPPNIATIQNKLASRGPDMCVAHHIDMYKTNYHLLDKQYSHEISKGDALGLQSILHLRGSHSYIP